MKPEDVLREAEAIDSDIKNSGQDIKRIHGPHLIILGVFISLLIVLMVFPLYSVKLDPEPKIIPAFSEVVQGDIEPGNESIDNRNQMLLFLKPWDPVVKQTADRIISLSGCPGHRVCQAKAIFYFVRDNFMYSSDPLNFEYIKSARESLISPVGDCDDMAVMLANLLEAIGINTRFVFVPNHVYVDAYLPESIRRYQKEGWVSMDATCKSCDFGELSYMTASQEKTYLLR